MSEIIGKRVICDRCKKEVFLKFLDKESRMRADLSNKKNFDVLPAGWYSSGLSFSSRCTRCPECEELYRKKENEFWEGNDEN